LLKIEDGAQFCGAVTYIEPGLYRAHCYALIDGGSSIDMELPEHEMCDSRDAGVRWIKRRAAARGFNRVTFDAVPS